MVGKIVRHVLEGEWKPVFDEFSKNNPSIKAKEASEGLKTLMDARGEDVPSYFAKTRKEIESRIGDKPILKQLLRKLDIAEQLHSDKGVRDFTDRYGERLDAYADKAIEYGILKPESKRVSFMHNSIAMLEDHMNAFEKALYGEKFTFSDTRAAKKFDNGIEAELNGHKPASDDFFDHAGAYWDSAANATRFHEFDASIRADAARKDPQLMIETSRDSAEPAYILKDEKNSQWKKPEGYKDLSKMGSQYAGMYAHPEAFRWMKAVLESPNKPSDFGLAYIRFNQLTKRSVLGLVSGYHLMSLAKKSIYLTARMGTSSILSPVGTPMRGLEAIRGGKGFDVLMEAMQQGFVFGQHDIWENPAFTKKYNVQGDQTTLSSLSENIRKFTSWPTEFVFDKARTGMKTGMLLDIAQSKWFENIEAKEGRDVALRNTSDILNLHFGGHNLEAIGRSRPFQTVLQGLLLAPDWTESKVKRLFGAAIAKDPNLRKALFWSLTAEAVSVAMFKVVLQGVSDRINSTKGNTWDNWVDDVFHRRFGTIDLGREKGAGSKDLRWDFGGSENQDIETGRLFVKLLWGMEQSIQHNDTDYLQKAWDAIKKESLYRASPLANIAAGSGPAYASRKEGKTLLESVEKFMPIAGSEIIEAYRGKFGGSTSEERLAQAAKTGALSVIGLPLKAYNIDAEKKKDKAEAKAEEAKARSRGEKGKGKPVRVLE